MKLSIARLAQRTLEGLIALCELNFERVETVLSEVRGTVTIFSDATDGSKTVLLPAGRAVTDKDYLVVKLDGTANTVVITPAVGQTIEGATSYTLSTQYQKAFLTFYYPTNTWLLR